MDKKNIFIETVLCLVIYYVKGELLVDIFNKSIILQMFKVFFFHNLSTVNT